MMRLREEDDRMRRSALLIWAACAVAALAWLLWTWSRGELEPSWWVRHAITAFILGVGYLVGTRMARRYGR